MGKNDVTKVIDRKQCVTTAFLASAYEVTPKTLSEWRKQGCPQVARGYWDLSAVIKWHEAKILDGVKTDDDKDLNPLQRKLFWETEYKKQKAKGAELQNQISLGEYVSKYEVKKELENFLVVFKQVVLVLPRKIGISIQNMVEKEVAHQVESISAKEIDSALREWSVGKFEE